MQNDVCYTQYQVKWLVLHVKLRKNGLCLHAILTIKFYLRTFEAPSTYKFDLHKRQDAGSMPIT